MAAQKQSQAPTLAVAKLVLLGSSLLAASPFFCTEVNAALPGGVEASTNARSNSQGHLLGGTRSMPVSRMPSAATSTGGAFSQPSALSQSTARPFRIGTEPPGGAYQPVSSDTTINQDRPTTISEDESPHSCSSAMRPRK